MTRNDGFKLITVFTAASLSVYFATDSRKMNKI